MTYPSPRLRQLRPQKLSPEQAVLILLKSHYQCTIDDVSENTRKRTVLYLRQSVQTCLTRHSEMTLGQIGFFTGLKDHATVLHARKQIEKCEYLYRKYGTKHELLTLYQIFESRYKALMQENKVIVTRHYRSAKDELINSKLCTR